MSEEFSGIPEAPQAPETFEAAPEKKKKTLWIILGIVAALLLCCCLVVVLGSTLGLISLGDFSYQFSPFLALV